VLLDVRKKSEVEQGKIKGSIHLELNELKSKIPFFDKNEKWLVYCAGGYRSMIAASLMKAHGISNVSNVQGGINKAKQIIPELIEHG
jgi:rhodanese-related sulfurtransferase